jgi:hypothetical protein
MTFSILYATAKRQERSVTTGVPLDANDGADAALVAATVAVNATEDQKIEIEQKISKVLGL